MSTHRMTRRSFLQTSAVTTGALMASKRLLLEPERIPEAWEFAAPSDTVRFGIIGVYNSLANRRFAPPRTVPFSSPNRHLDRRVCFLGRHRKRLLVFLCALGSSLDFI